MIDLTVKFDTVLARIADAHLRHPEVPPALRESILYSLLAPGKRLRPRLTLAASSLVGLPEGAAWQAAAAIEALHCASLIHDDLPAMDDDDYRRGRLANHRAHGEALAILAGDALIVMGFDMLTDAAQHGCTAEAVQRALKRLLRAYGPLGLAGGQAAEMAGIAGPAEVARVRHMKTTVLFEAAVSIPADLVSTAPQSREARLLSELGSALGEVFQMADDLDDVAHDQPDANLYRYADAEARVATARERLNLATRALTSHYGSRAAPVVTIAAALAAKLDAPPYVRTTATAGASGGRP